MQKEKSSRTLSKLRGLEDEELTDLGAEKAIVRDCSSYALALKSSLRVLVDLDRAPGLVRGVASVL